MDIKQSRQYKDEVNKLIMLNPGLTRQQAEAQVDKNIEAAGGYAQGGGFGPMDPSLSSGNPNPQADINSMVKHAEVLNKYIGTLPTPAQASLTEVLKNAVENQQMSKTTRRDVMPTQQWEQVLSTIDPSRSMGDPMLGLSSFKQGIADKSAQLQQLRELRGREPIDLSPLMAYSDSRFGTNLLKGYQRPKSDVDFQMAEQALQDSINKERFGYSGREMQLAQLLAGQGPQYVTGTRDTAKDSQQIQPQITIKNPPAAAPKETSGKAPGEDKSAKELMKTKQFQGLMSIPAVFSTLDSLEKNVNDYAAKPFLEQLKPDRDLSSNYSLLITDLNRDLAKLGALAGADLSLLVAQLPDPQSFTSRVVTEITSLGKSDYFEEIKGILRKIRNRLKVDASSAMDSLRISYGDKPKAGELLDAWDKKIFYGGPTPKGSAAAPVNKDELMQKIWGGK